MDRSALKLVEGNAPKRRTYRPNASADQVLHLLKTRGPQSATDIGRGLGTTGENARQQLTKLAAEGLVSSYPVRQPAGRPILFWTLAEAGHALFPDTHADVLVDLLRVTRDAGGQEAIDRLVRLHESERLETYENEMRDARSLGQKVVTLARLRTSEGYMAEWRDDTASSFLLIENHCPILKAATECREFCRQEQDLFQNALGPDVHVERIEHAVVGARRCAYRVSSRRDADRRAR